MQCGLAPSDASAVIVSMMMVVVVVLLLQPPVGLHFAVDSITSIGTITTTITINPVEKALERRTAADYLRQLPTPLV